MKLFLTLVVVAASVVIIYFFVLGYLSKKSDPVGIVDDRLAACSQKPNCVCSEHPEDAAHFILPLRLKEESVRSGLSSNSILLVIKESITESGGKLLGREAQPKGALYLAANYQSSLFGFIDDLEIRLDPHSNLVHFRSSSRVGHSDFGVNKKRVELLKSAIIRRLQ
ncbi:DUF1499 domain-containing protein [Neptunomonas sp.]|uniref:DUF1499 domain-containing protein n=1 Tax=Neptunomonas sp. TaxID=1971898 RepID=UPI0025E0D78A|nr:DUF1499 domain-containing protein [Neptunomonas sp.]